MDPQALAMEEEHAEAGSDWDTASEGANEHEAPGAPSTSSASAADRGAGQYGEAASGGLLACMRRSMLALRRMLHALHPTGRCLTCWPIQPLGRLPALSAALPARSTLLRRGLLVPPLP